MKTGTVVHFSTRSATLPKLKCPSLPWLAWLGLAVLPEAKNLAVLPFEVAGGDTRSQAYSATAWWPR